MEPDMSKKEVAAIQWLEMKTLSAFSPHRQIIRRNPALAGIRATAECAAKQRHAANDKS
jgi:hypothetical protein